MTSELLNNEIKTLDQLYIDYTNKIYNKTKAFSFKSWTKFYDTCKTPNEYETKIQKLINNINKETTIKNLEEKIKKDENNNSEIEYDPKLKEIFLFLGINTNPDGRLNVKAKLMKEIITLCSIWKYGAYATWVNRISIRTCLSTRKVKEDYIEPLISEGILELIKQSDETLIFKGIPKKEKTDVKT